MDSNVICDFLLQLRRPVSTLSIPGSMKSGAGNKETNRETTCNESSGAALVGVHSEYPRYVPRKCKLKIKY